MNRADAHRLQETFRSEYRSLLQYIRGAAPYAAGPDRAIRDSVMRIAQEEGEALDSFGELLEDNRVTLPYLGSFPVEFTDLNFVTIRHLLPKLVAEQKRDLANLEAEVPLYTDGIARAADLRLVELHKRHLNELEALG
jgi:hypothetical protein